MSAPRQANVLGQSGSCHGKRLFPKHSVTVLLTLYINFYSIFISNFKIHQGPGTPPLTSLSNFQLLRTAHHETTTHASYYV